MLLGAFLKTYARGKASEAIAKLLELQPPQALRLTGFGRPGAIPTDLQELERELGTQPLVEVEVASLLTGDIVKVQDRVDSTQAAPSWPHADPSCPKLPQAAPSCPKLP